MRDIYIDIIILGDSYMFTITVRDSYKRSIEDIIWGLK